MDALVSAQVAAPPSDDQEKETVSCCLQRTSEAEPEKQDEDTEEDSDDEDDTEIPPEAVITRAPVLFQSPSGKVLYFCFLRRVFYFGLVLAEISLER
jgi:hypothetical protein